MLQIGRACNGRLRPAFRTVSALLCFALFLAGLVDFQRHTYHAGHQIDQASLSADHVSDHENDHTVAAGDHSHASADYHLALSHTDHDNTKQQHDVKSECDAHSCLTAITVTEARVSLPAPTRRFGLVADEFGTARPSGALYRPPITRL